MWPVHFLVALTPGKEPLIRIKLYVGGETESVWTLGTIGNSVAPVWNRSVVYLTFSTWPRQNFRSFLERHVIYIYIYKQCKLPQRVPALPEWQKVFPGFEPCAVLNEFFSHFVGGPTEVQISDSRVCAVTTEV